MAAETSIVTGVLRIASEVSTPLAVGAFCAALLFLVARQIVARNIFPRLNEVLGAGLLRQIIDRLFVLSLVAIMLAFAAHLLPAFVREPVPSPTPTPSTQELEKIGREFFSVLYTDTHKALYDRLASPLKANTSYGDLMKLADRELYQYRTAQPIARRLSGSPLNQSGYWYLLFESEVDEVSRVREGILLIREPAGWRFQNYQVQPATWPASAQLVQFSPHSTLAAFHAGGVGVGVNTWIPATGWELDVSGVGARIGERTCDVQARATSAKVEVILRGTAGGCDRQAGDELLVYGRIARHSESAIDIVECRMYPRPKK